MTSSKSEQSPYGTALTTTQDGSEPVRIQEGISHNPATSVAENQCSFNEKSWDSDDSSTLSQGVQAEGDDDEEKGVVTRQLEPSYSRPYPVTRQTTDASGCAAPYARYCVSDYQPQERQVDNHKRTRGLSTSSSTTHQSNASIGAPASRISTDAEGNTYPEGGTKAYLCVFGSLCGCMLSLGMMNTIGTFQAYVSHNQLQGLSESQIGWIFGLYAFLAFFCGIQIGPIFDAKGPRWLVLSGSILILLSYLLLGVCTQYWHFMIVFGLLGGLGTSLVFTPSVAAIGHFFLRERGQWTGLACVGGSLGGIVYPLTLQALFPQIGWAWSTRVLALINLILAIFANLFIRSRLPSKPATKEAILPDPRIFRDPTFSLTVLGVFFIEWGLFVPLGYLTSYAIQAGIDEQFSYQLVAVFNVGSCFGRYFPGLIADKIGRFNALTLTTILCLIASFAVWLPAGSSVAAIVIFAVLFGFASGAGISLTPVCVGQLCRTENYGRYYATCYTVVSFASLTAIPIAGALLGATNGRYWGVIIFTGLSYFASFATFTLARVLKVGWSLKVAF